METVLQDSTISKLSFLLMRIEVVAAFLRYQVIIFPFELLQFPHTSGSPYLYGLTVFAGVFKNIHKIFDRRFRFPYSTVPFLISAMTKSMFNLYIPVYFPTVPGKRCSSHRRTLFFRPHFLPVFEYGCPISVHIHFFVL